MTAATITAIMREVATENGLTVEDLVSPKRNRAVAHPRQESMWRCRQLRRPDGKHRFSYPQIGMAHGGRDHTTAMHAIKKYEDRCGIATDPQPLTEDHCHAL